MKAGIFIDTSAFVAITNRHDQFHASACEAFRFVESRSPRITTNAVLLETCLYLERRVSTQASRRFWRSLISGEARVELYYLQNKDYERAYEIAAHYSDQEFSIADCLSFAAIERLGINWAFSFDDDFLVFRLPTGPIKRVPE